MSRKKRQVPTIRSSAAEYLTFIAASGDDGIEALYVDEDVWLSQKMMGLLFDVETHTINYHLKKVFSDNELVEDSVIRNFRITARDNKSYNTNHYNLSVIAYSGQFCQLFRFKLATESVSKLHLIPVTLAIKNSLNPQF